MIKETTKTSLKQGSLDKFIKSTVKPLKDELEGKINKEELSLIDEFSDDLSSWKPKLQGFLKTQKWKQIYDFVKKQYLTEQIYPPYDLIFNAFKLTHFDKLKVVIVGQDPYHQKGQAMGLSFSVPQGVKPPPSLVNIFKCISDDPNIQGFTQPNHGDLTKWATQGVFCLNAFLTVQDSKPESHKNCGWADFTDYVIKTINNEHSGIIFLLWGLPAQKKAKFVDQNKHHVLQSVHPSPLSAHRGFLTCQHFSKVNEILRNNNQTEINWNIS